MPRFFLARFTFLFSPNRLPGVLELIVCIFGRFAVGHLAVGPAHGFCKVVRMRLVVRLVGGVHCARCLSGRPDSTSSLISLICLACTITYLDDWRLDGQSTYPLGSPDDVRVGNLSACMSHLHGQHA